MNIELFECDKSFKVSETFFNKLESKLIEKKLDKCFNNDVINGYYDTFTNNREQGLILTIYKSCSEDSICYWACQERSSDNIMIIIGDVKHRDANTNCYDEEVYKLQKCFRYNEIDKAVEYVYNHIKLAFKNELDYPKDIKFRTNYKLGDLARIGMDVESLDYNDYDELATFENVTEGYTNDLIILDGKLVWRISKAVDDEFDNITGIDAEPDFSSDTNLMLQMQEVLNKFIDEELEYKISI